MGAKRKKIQAAGRFGAGYGTRTRKRLNAVEVLQRKKQVCPYCSKAGVKRISAGIWHCKKCGKKFAGPAYALAKQI
jgi:large subunit ribosomal protein L37Ae